MDSFELNKIIGAILGTLLFVMGVGLLAEAVYEPREAGPGVNLPVPEGTAVAEAAEPVAATPIAVLLASADVAAGQSAARKCQSCHNFAEGSGNKTGPVLWDTVGKTIATHDGFAYSAIFEEYREAGRAWTYEDLNQFLLAPRDYAPGTKMNFAGLKNEAERANVIAYMASLSASPVPFPAPEAVVEAPAADAELPEAAIAAEPSDAEPVATDADAVETPTTMPTDTPVEGTPISETTPGADTTMAPAEPAAAPLEPATPPAQ
jgi:cytochrome c